MGRPVEMKPMTDGVTFKASRDTATGAFVPVRWAGAVLRWVLGG